MRLRKSIFAIALLMFATIACAAAEDKVVCPPLDVVINASSKVDTAMSYRNAYLVYTGTTVYRDAKLGWGVGVKGVVAGSEQEAIEKGKQIVLKANVRKEEYARKIQANLYSCHYGPSDIVALGSPDAPIMKFLPNL